MRLFAISIKLRYPSWPKGLNVDRPVQIAKKDSWKLFDKIAGTYDLLNALVSLGTHSLWRRRMVGEVVGKRDLVALDLATGTADMALLLAREERVQRVVGLDLSREMIALGEQKVLRQGFGKKISLGLGDGTHLEEEDASFDLVTLAFGIRNFSDVPRALAHVHRVLRPGGQVLIMEFGLPRNFLLRLPYLFYLRNILPLVGRIVSGHPFAYSYLNRTVESFPYGTAFSQLLEEAGLTQLKAISLFGGVAYIYSGRK